MKNVYIFTNFQEFLKSYSPIIVVESQLKMLKRAGYEPVLFANEGWEAPEDSVYASVKTEHLYPVHSSSGDKVDKTFHEEVELLAETIEKALVKDAVVLTHDLIFLPDYVKHNLACRKVADKRPDVKWIHWVHSATGPNTLIQEREIYGEKYKELLLSKFPNSIVAYPNAHDIPRVARNFSYEEFEVIEVPHATDPTEGLRPIVKRLYDEKELGNVDVLMVYPLRLDRGKAAEANVRVVAACKEIGLEAHLVYCDFQSTGDDKVVYRGDLHKLAHELGVENNLTFLSEFDESSHLESDHQVILDLFTLSNIFILPSRSETYSLITQEAMLKGNLPILNYDFPAFRQIYGNNALYRQFDGAEIALDGFDGKTDTTHSDINAYYKERLAMPIKGWLENDIVLKSKTWVRKERNPDTVFRKYLEPLLFGGGHANG